MKILTTMLLLSCLIVTNECEVTLQLSASTDLVFLNKQVIFTISIENQTNKEQENIIVLLSLPVELEYITSKTGEYFPARKQKAYVRWFLPEIKEKERIELKVTARGIIEADADVHTVAKLKNKNISAVATTSLRVKGVRSGGGVSTYDTEDPVMVGENTTYVIHIRNDGRNSATNVVLRNDISPQMELVSIKSPMKWEYNKEKHQVEFQAHNILKPGEEIQYRITCCAIIPGSAKNTARIKYDQFSKEILDEEGTSIYE